MNLNELDISIYGDGADLAGIKQLVAKPYIKGLTTNPSLMHKAGVQNYETFAKEVLAITDLPVSFEVMTGEPKEMVRQAKLISSWGANVYVKIPIINGRGDSSEDVIRELALSGVKLNITAILTLTQVADAYHALLNEVPSIVSLFCGRIADTGESPHRIISFAHHDTATAQILWASTREPYNIVQAASWGCDIITVPNDILLKAEKMFGKNLTELSLETVQMFERDAQQAGYVL